MVLQGWPMISIHHSPPPEEFPVPSSTSKGWIRPWGRLTLSQGSTKHEVHTTASKIPAENKIYQSSPAVPQNHTSLRSSQSSLNQILGTSLALPEFFIKKLPYVQQHLLLPHRNPDYSKISDIHLQGHPNRGLQASAGVVCLTTTKHRGHFDVPKCPEGDFYLLSPPQYITKARSLSSQQAIIYLFKTSFISWDAVCYLQGTHCVVTWSKFQRAD